MLGRVMVAGLLVATSTVIIMAQERPARSHTSDSRVSLDVTDDTVRRNQEVKFFGEVRNSHSRCRDGRVVRLNFEDEGTVDIDRTDVDGEFVFRIDPHIGNYYASVRRSGRFGYDDRHRCGGDESGEVDIRRSS
jgi:hypothetical protein